MNPAMATEATAASVTSAQNGLTGKLCVTFTRRALKISPTVARIATPPSAQLSGPPNVPLMPPKVMNVLSRGPMV